MLVTCPNCQTEYNVPDAALTGRVRKLRCASCMTKFEVPALDMYRQDPAAPEQEASGPAATEHEGDAILADQEEPAVHPDEALEDGSDAIAEPPKHEWVDVLQASRENPAAAQAEPFPKRGLAISALIVLVLVIALLVEHRAISQFWPPSLRLFNALGLK